MHEKVRSLEQQETGEIRRLRCAPIADNSGLSLWSSCVVISWFADGMRPRKRNGRKIEWGLDRMRQPGWRDRTGGENSHCRSDGGF
jgi:hypothetical protein